MFEHCPVKFRPVPVLCTFTAPSIRLLKFSRGYFHSSRPIFPHAFLIILSSRIAWTHTVRRFEEVCKQLQFQMIIRQFEVPPCILLSCSTTVYIGFSSSSYYELNMGISRLLLLTA